MITTQEDITKCIQQAKEKIATSEREFPALVDLFNNLPGKVHFAYFYPEQANIIARVETRAAFAPVRALRHGKWEKHFTTDDGFDTCHYTGELDCGVRVSIHVHEFPPSCRIIKTQVTLPAKPERVVTVTKVQCDAATREEVQVDANAEPTLV